MVKLIDDYGELRCPECDTIICCNDCGDMPEKVIKTDTCSQACPACHSPVNGNYCHNCGKALIY